MGLTLWHWPQEWCLVTVHAYIECVCMWDADLKRERTWLALQLLLCFDWVSEDEVKRAMDSFCRDAPTRNEHQRKMNPLPSWLHLRTLNQNTATIVELTKYAPSSSQHLTCTHIQYMHAPLPSITLEANVKESVPYREPPRQACCAAKAGDATSNATSSARAA
jgi:hypothetical protein